MKRDLWTLPIIQKFPPFWTCNWFFFKYLLKYIRISQDNARYPAQCHTPHNHKTTFLAKISNVFNVTTSRENYGSSKSRYHLSILNIFWMFGKPGKVMRNSIFMQTIIMLVFFDESSKLVAWEINF